MAEALETVVTHGLASQRPADLLMLYACPSFVAWIIPTHYMGTGRKQNS